MAVLASLKKNKMKNKNKYKDLIMSFDASIKDYEKEVKNNIKNFKKIMNYIKKEQYDSARDLYNSLSANEQDFPSIDDLHWTFLSHEIEH
jgi:hypothetical protein